MKCENCQADVTFWSTVRQMVPFRFHCLACGAKYRVSAPGLGPVFAIVMFLFGGLLYGFTLGFQEYGIAVIMPYLSFVLGTWLAVELAMYRYITKKGTFALIGKHGRCPVGPADGAGQANACADTGKDSLNT